MNLSNIFEEIVKTENLFEAWKEFVVGKISKRDVQNFFLNLSDNILSLKTDIVNEDYRHGGYEAFNISDPKPRNIHKASVRDRLIHHAIYRVIYPRIDKVFIADSYSCRTGKGTHKAIERFDCFSRKVSKNNTRTVWVLKCDIRKFFASINHEILLKILDKHIADRRAINLLREIIISFNSVRLGVGLPLGNLTSQLLVNIYMNEFDQFIKHVLRIKYYIRYADDFLFMSPGRDFLVSLVSNIDNFLKDKLKLTLHPNKMQLETLSSGIEFLGWVNFPKYRILKTKTKKRMIKRLMLNPSSGTIASYVGLMKHGNTYNLKNKIFSGK